MKKIKITLPEGGQRKCKNGVVIDLNKGTVFGIDASEIIIEGDVSLNLTSAQRIPFDLEAAKAGAQVLWGDDPVRWVGRGNEKSSIQAFNIIEHSHGLAYAPDKDLFMAPKTPKIRYLNITVSASESNSPHFITTYPTKEGAVAASRMNPPSTWALVAYPIVIKE